MGVIFSYIFAALFIGLGLVIFIWFFKNKPEGEVDTAAELLNTPQGLMTRKGRMTVVLVALSFLAVGALLLWVAIN
jgi:hypothetical protein